MPLKRGVDSQGPYFKKGSKKVHYKPGDKRSRESAKGRVEGGAKPSAKSKKMGKPMIKRGGFVTAGARPRASYSVLSRLADKENLQHGIRIGRR